METAGTRGHLPTTINGPSIEHVTVIIVNWNAVATLRACLRALFASEGADPPQVIVVDNASTDGSLAGLTSTYPAPEIIRNAENVGFARAARSTPWGCWSERGSWAAWCYGPCKRS